MIIDWGDIIKLGITTVGGVAVVVAPLWFQNRRLAKQMDGINSKLREDGAAKDGEINRLQDPDSGLTPQTRADGSGGAPVTVDRRTKTVTVTPKPEPDASL